MAIDNDLPIIPMLSRVSSSSSLRKSMISLTSSPSTERRATIAAPVGTHNSAAFIQFPTTARQSSPFVPVNQGTPSLTRRSSQPTETRSSSCHSKSSRGQCPSVSSEQAENGRSQRKSNPILDNPLLNYRKKQLQELEKHLAAENAQATNKLESTENPSKRSESDKDTSDSEKELTSSSEYDFDYNDDSEYFDQNKHEFITRWLNNVKAPNLSRETSSKPKSSKK